MLRSCYILLTLEENELCHCAILISQNIGLFEEENQKHVSIHTVDHERTLAESRQLIQLWISQMCGQESQPAQDLVFTINKKREKISKAFGLSSINNNPHC